MFIINDARPRMFIINDAPRRILIINNTPYRILMEFPEVHDTYYGLDTGNGTFSGIVGVLQRRVRGKGLMQLSTMRKKILCIMVTI